MDSNKSIHSTFTIEYTNYAKGIAIIILLVHHLIFIPFHIPFTSGIIHELIVLWCKVCVPLFCVLSGFGITKSFQKYSANPDAKDSKFALNHLKKLLYNYWWVYIPVLIISLTLGFRGSPWKVYGTGIKGFLNCVIDFCGMRAMFQTPTFSLTWWFIEAALVFYAVFPWLYKAYKKVPIITLFVLFIPLLYRQFFKTPEFLKSSDREIFYLFSFAVGMFLADRGILDKLISWSNARKYKYFSLSIVLVLIGAVSAMFLPFIGMLIFALSIIAVVVFMKSIKLNFSKVFEFLGKYSMNVFLTHSLYMDYIRRRIWVDSLGVFNYILQFAIVLVISFALSVALEYIKKLVRNKFINKKYTANA